MGYENILPSSTNPTMPFTCNTIDEHLTCHGVIIWINESRKTLPSLIPVFARKTIVAEDVSTTWVSSL